MEYHIIRKILLDCFKIDRIDYERTSVLTTAHDNDRSLLLADGKYYSPLIDTMEDDLAKKGVKCVSIARIISEVKGELSYGNARSPEGRFARALVFKRVRRLIFKKAYPFSHGEEKTWAEILERTGATRVFGIQPSRELCAACHKRGIWVADVQHGVISDNHPWYGEKFRPQDPLDQLPDAFLLWDYGSQQVIDKWARTKRVATKVIGNRWLARFMAPTPEDSLVRDIVSNFRRELGGTDKPVILVSLSWGDYNIPNGFIAPGLEAAIRSTAHQYRWLIRLHPNQVKGFATYEGARFRKYFDSSLKGFAEWDVATKPALPAVLKSIHLNISWMSSVCIEAAQMGVKSALLNPRLRFADQIGDYYEYYRGIGMVELVEEQEEAIVSWISRNIGQKSPPEDYTKFDQEYGALLNFLAGDTASR